MDKDEKEFMDCMEYIFQAPLIEFPGQNFPPMMAADHILFRLLEGPACVDKEVATGYETLAYLSTASLAGPLDTNLTDVMQHLFNRYFPDKAFGGEDPRVSNLNADCQRALHSLQHWIFKKQVQHIKTKQQSKRSEAKATERRAQHSLQDFMVTA